MCLEHRNDTLDRVVEIVEDLANCKVVQLTSLYLQIRRTNSKGLQELDQRPLVVLVQLSAVLMAGIRVAGGALGEKAHEVAGERRISARPEDDAELDTAVED